MTRNRRWGATGRVETDDARNRLLDAAERCFIRFGVAKTTVEDVANAAQVSRATVYRYFAGRDELVLGVLMRDAHGFFERLGRRLAAGGELGDVVVDAVLFTVRQVRADPHLQLLFSPEAAGVTSTVAGASTALFAETTAFLMPYLETARHSGLLRGDTPLEDVAEWILRMVISLLLVRGPVARNEEEQKRFLQTFFVPALTGRAEW